MKMCSFGTSVGRLFGLSVLSVAMAFRMASAMPVSSSEAKTAVGNWLSCEARLGCRLGTSVASVRTCTTNGASFHIVKLAGGGVVVTSADTQQEPVVAFSPSEDLIESEQNPLWTMLCRDFSVQPKVARLSHASVSGAQGRAGTSAMQKWARLLPAKATNGLARLSHAAAGLATVSDVRVAPLLATRWSQRQDSYYANMGDPCYNYYTPNNYPCGCVATAAAQIMRYHRYPVSAVVPGTYGCRVNGARVCLTMQGGVYDWDNMPDDPARGTTLQQRRAIGKLTSDVGIASLMRYASGGSSAAGYMPAMFLTERFGYASAVAFAGGDLETETILSAALPNLDAKLPVVLGLSNASEGHAVVADGYGYSLGTLYLHLNMGWAGKDDAWYAPPDAENFTSVDSVVCNVYATGESGRVICSGRVLTAETGTPVAGCEVTATGVDATETVTTDDKGIYAFLLKAGSYVISSEGTKIQVTLASNVPTEITDDGLYYIQPVSVGNRYGCDLSVSTETPPPSAFTVVFDLGSYGTQTGGGALVQAVAAGEAADEPTFSVSTGWRFVGWDRSFDRVTADLTVTARYEEAPTGVRAGAWTANVAAVKAAADCRLVVVLCANYGGCWWSQRAQPVFESSVFLDWAAAHGVYLVTSDESRLPSGYSDASGAGSWFWTLYWSWPLRSDAVYYPTIAVARSPELNCAVGFDVVRDDGASTVGGVLYDGTVQTLIEGLTTYLPAPVTVKIPRPRVKTGLVYSGSVQDGFEAYDSRIRLTGQDAATEAGSDYQARFDLPEDTETQVYTWDDDTASPVICTWGIAARDVADADVVFASISDQTYTGEPIEPTVTMTYAEIERVLGVDYEIAYSDNVEAGTASVMVTGRGNFSGTRMLDFEIRPASPVAFLVTFDADGGSCAETSRTVAVGAPIGGLPTPTRDGYTFAGWFSVVDGGGCVRMSAETPVMADLILRAQWYVARAGVVRVLVGENVAYRLTELGVELPDADKVSVKIEGLPKGLKYKDGVISGTPTEELDFETQPVFARVTATIGKLKIETVLPVPLQVDAECPYVHTVGDSVSCSLGEDVKTASGLPKGLKFNKQTGFVSGKPTKAGVSVVKLTMRDGSKRTVLWKVEQAVAAGVLGSVAWTVEDHAVHILQGVLQEGWSVDVPPGAKLTVSGLPSGLTYKNGLISGTPAKAGSFIVTFKTTLGGNTTIERVLIAVADNEWAGDWYGLQDSAYDRASLNVAVTVSANGKVKLVCREDTAKVTVFAKNLDASGTTATLVVNGRICLLDFENGTMTVKDVDGADVRVADICEAVPTLSTETEIAFNMVEVDGDVTNVYGRVTARYNAKKATFALSGKLFDGTVVKGTTCALNRMTETGGLYLAPVLVKNKAKKSIYLEFSDDGRWCRVLENGESLPVFLAD